MQLNVDNCPTCGTVFQKNFRKMCLLCSKQLDADIKKCVDYLWKFPNTTTIELSEATDIKSSMITKLMKDGIISKTFKKLTYPCESCGVEIKDNRLCYSCTVSFKEIAQQIKTSNSVTPMQGYQITQRLSK